MNASVQTTVLPLLAQMGSDINIDLGSGISLVGSALGAFLTTLVVGGIMVAVVPDFTERMMAAVLENPVGSFVYGVVCLVAAVVVTVLLVITIVGILAAVPLGLATYLLWAVGSAIAYLAIGDRLVGREDGWLKPLLVGAGINGALTLTGIGGIVAFCIGAAGFGAVLRDVLA